MHPMKLSVVITTFDRVDLLKHCLDDLALQTLSTSEFEVIVIDNAGQEACRALVVEYQARYVHEEKVGHCHARNRGLQEAKAPWVLYFDDDVRLPNHILEKYLELLPSVNGPAFGGQFLHWYLHPPPPWLVQHLGTGKRPGAASSFGILPPGKYLIGCFFGVDAARAIALGGFDPELGMKGKEVGWADETELQFRMRAAGDHVAYAPELVIEHLVQPWKCSFRGQLRYAYSHGRMSWLPEDNAKRGYGLGEYLLEVMRILFIVFPTTMLRWGIKHRYWYWQNAALRVLAKLAFASGRLNKRRKIYTDK